MVACAAILILLTATAAPALAADRTVSAAVAATPAGQAPRDATPEINHQIWLCAQSGGGRVTVPPGQYHVKVINMQSNVDLHISGGARLIASRNWDDYRKGSDGYWSFESAMINADGLENIKVTGTGIIDGNRNEVPNPSSARNNFEYQNFIRAEVTGLWDERRGAHIINFRNCWKVFIGNGGGGQRLILVNSGNYSMLLNGCRTTEIRQVDVWGGWDGIHARATIGMNVQDVRIQQNLDDGIAAHNTLNWTINNVLIDGRWDTINFNRIPDGSEKKTKTYSQGNGLRFGGKNFTATNVTVKNKLEAGLHHFAPIDYDVNRHWRVPEVHDSYGSVSVPNPTASQINSRRPQSEFWTIRNWKVENVRSGIFYDQATVWHRRGPLSSANIENLSGFKIRSTPFVFRNGGFRIQPTITLRGANVLIDAPEVQRNRGRLVNREGAYGLAAQNVFQLDIVDRSDGFRNTFNYKKYSDTRYQDRVVVPRISTVGVTRKNIQANGGRVN